MKHNRKISKWGFLATLLAGYLVLSGAQRLMYTVWIAFTNQEWVWRLPLAMGKGLAFDLAAAFYMFLPLAIFLLAVPKRFAQRLWFRAVTLVFALVPLFLASWAAIGEIFFFEEFHARFNFIAVDYLIYTTEVIRNIIESYSLFVTIPALMAPAVILVILLRRQARAIDPGVRISRRRGGTYAAVGFAAVLAAALVTEEGLLAGDSYWPREIGKNSLFALFTAYHHNAINYKEFYSSLPSSEARAIARESLGGLFTNEEALVREVQAPGQPHEWNVVMVVMESMSAAFLAHYGNHQPITPNLDRLADEGLFFTNLYATGTRTVRGLEALMLSLPPTPGQSILRRPKSDGMFNFGSPFRARGYKTQFLYGGYGYFDNMKEWYESNGFEVIDRAVFPSSEIHFGNAWGVCDEDLFDQTLKQEENLTSKGQHFAQVVMTTSNHRPYTFPDGRIDMESGSGREAAIKYSDYAIGRFMEQAQSKPWFKDTIFVFVADHDAAVAGGTDIPVRDYLIPAIVYNPQLIRPQKVSKLASQIDLAPTLLALLNFSYPTHFFGTDLLHNSPERAFLGTYQKVALLRPPQMTLLTPGRAIETQELDEKFNVVKTMRVMAQNPSQVPASARETIALYQSASELFTQGLLKENANAPTARNADAR